MLSAEVKTRTPKLLICACEKRRQSKICGWKSFLMLLLLVVTSVLNEQTDKLHRIVYVKSIYCSIQDNEWHVSYAHRLVCTYSIEIDGCNCACAQRTCITFKNKFPRNSQWRHGHAFRHGNDVHRNIYKNLNQYQCFFPLT